MANGSLALAPLAQQQITNVSNAVDLTINFASYVSATAPSNPINGQFWVYTADATNGINWLFMYRSASASTYKWECVGGPPMYAEVTTAETTASVAYAALATAGPSVVVPFAGDYDVEIGCQAFDTTNASTMFMSYDIGGTGAVNTDSVGYANPVGVATTVFTGSRLRRKTALAAVTLTAKYKVDSGTGSFANRWVSVRPVRTAG